MNFELFFARKISFQTQRSASALVVRLAIISVALAVATMEISLSFVQGFESEIENKVAGFASHILVTNYRQEINEERLTLKYVQEDIDRTLALPQVSSVSPFADHIALLRYSNRDTIRVNPDSITTISQSRHEGVQVKGVPQDYHWKYLEEALLEGKVPDFSAQSEILVSKKIARKLLLDVGSKAELLVFLGNDVQRKAVYVSGIYETGLEEFDNRMIVADLSLVQVMRGWAPNEIAGYEVNTHTLDRVPAWSWDWGRWPFLQQDSLSSLDHTTLDVSAIAPDFLATPVTYTFADIFDWLKLQHQNVWVILILMMIVAIINMTSVILIIIIERTRTVGILKSMGMKGRRIQRMFVWYAMLLILIGVILGNLLGLGVLYSQHSLEWLQVNQEDYFISTVPVAWVWDRFLLVNLGVILVCTLAMYLPGMIVQRITPVRAIRFE